MSKPKKQRGVITLRIRRADFARMLHFIACVNDQPLRIAGKVHQPETLLFMPPTASVRVDRRGFSVWRLTGRLWIRRRGWNTFERDETGRFESMLNAETGERLTPYRPVDFRELLKGVKVL